MKIERLDKILIVVLGLIFFFITPHPANRGVSGAIGGLLGSLFAALIIVITSRFIVRGLQKLLRINKE